VHVLKEKMVPLASDEPYELCTRNGIVGAHVEGRGLIEEQILPADLVFLTERVDLAVHFVCGENERGGHYSSRGRAIAENAAVLNDEGMKTGVPCHLGLPLMEQSGGDNDNMCGGDVLAYRLAKRRKVSVGIGIEVSEGYGGRTGR